MRQAIQYCHVLVSSLCTYIVREGSGNTIGQDSTQTPQQGPYSTHPNHRVPRCQKGRISLPLVIKDHDGGHNRGRSKIYCEGYSVLARNQGDEWLHVCWEVVCVDVDSLVQDISN